MGFKIFASGSTGEKAGGGRGHFHYSKDNCLDKGDFDPPAVLSWLPSTPDAAGIAEKIIGSPESHMDNVTSAGIMKIAEMELAHLVRNAVDMLAMHGDGEISVYCLQEKWYWADSNSFVKFKLGNSSNPGRDFIKAISPGLVKTELNDFGVLLEISIALSKYDQALPGSASPLINISLSH